MYLNEMHQLPTSVKMEFENGNFVVKGSPSSFNQVDPDQSQEWLNGTGKRGGGIVGITNNSSALSRWALSFNLRSEIARKTKQVFSSGNDHYVHNEATKSRRVQDAQDEKNLTQKLKLFGVFTSSTATLKNIATKDLATKAT